jgi:hypothetical protein
MFNYFHKKKFASQKGQLTPLFILIIVIIVIMAMVTVNLGKVSFIKTDSSNAADAAGLSAGSAMANSFNSVTVSSARMCRDYWSFYASISISFGIALYYLISAQVGESAATSGCMASACTAQAAHIAAIASFGSFESTMIAIGIAITAFYLKQWFNYAKIWDNTQLARKRALISGYSSAFGNSGISSKLRVGSPPATVTGIEEKHNYRDEFSIFIDNLGPEDLEHFVVPSSYTYSWIDGQNRAHSVKVDMGINDVETFKLQVSALPYPAVLALLAGITATSLIVDGEMSSATIFLFGACGCYAECAGPWYAACLAICLATECGLAAVPIGSAIAGMVALDIEVAALWVGLLPGPEVTIDDPDEALIYIVDWITDIDHDRKVTVNTTQQHQGGNLGLWQTSYPEISSYTKVDFRGNGDIGDFNPRHDASIIETDKL